MITQQKIRILYVEDDQALARLVEKRLEDLGNDVDLAFDAKGGQKQFQSSAYDVLIVDQTLPEGNGLNLVHAIAASGPLPVTIMVTGTGNETIAVEAMKLGLSDYLVKDLEGGFLNLLPMVIDNALRQRRLREESIQMEQELAQAHRLEAVGQLAAGIAHEINTPMQFVGDNTRFLKNAFSDINALLDKINRLLQAAKNGCLTPEALAEVENFFNDPDIHYLNREIPKAIDESLEGLGRVAAIVRAMNEFSHPGNAQKLNVDLAHAIENALTISRNEWKSVAKVATDFDPHLPMVACLPGDLNQVILSLIVNAAQAIAEKKGAQTGQEGAITIRTRQNGDWAEIHVGDTGAGIPEEIRHRVFDPFFTTKEPGKGSGQGLSIAHNIITKKHGGTIQFQSQIGQGTTFIIRLPIQEKPEDKTTGAYTQTKL
jgi:signal transduction histidine kinase